MNVADMPTTLDLGEGHSLKFTSRGDAIVGAIDDHTSPDGRPCSGAIMCDVPELTADDRRYAIWTVESWDPLTVAPSLLCSCGDHGHIREGRWLPV